MHLTVRPLFVLIELCFWSSLRMLRILLSAFMRWGLTLAKRSSFDRFLSCMSFCVALCRSCRIGLILVC